jgi:N-methylhydantoinase A
MPDGQSGDCAVGIDIGGTFTDVVLADGQGLRGAVKRLTTPADPAAAAVSATQQVMVECGVDPSSITRVVHGTTLATNVILERRGGRVALVTTAGFRHLLALGRHARVESDRFDLSFELPGSPVDLPLTFGIRERIVPSGEVLVALDEGAVKELAQQLESLELEGVAVCLLHSYCNPSHERRVGELLRASLSVPIVLSCDVSPEVREYERTTTTVMSALVAPVMDAYLRELAARLQGLGIVSPLYVMESAGGIMSVDQATRRAVATVESGPAAGVVAAGALGAELGVMDVVAFDMGGTTAKAALISGGRPGISHEFQVGGHGSFGSRRSGTGVPIRIPTIDLAEVGAGGGSVAWLDGQGTLHVGPRSAGAEPGPACYARGGLLPTVTDANVVLGYLELGGVAELPGFDARLAHDAVESHVARPLGIAVEAAASAIHDIATAMMAGALHVVTVQRGVDPRKYTLVSSGGAGPVHAARLAERFGIATVLVPPAAGVCSALGLLASDLRSEDVIALFRSADDVVPEEVEQAYCRMVHNCCVELDADGDTEEVTTRRALDIRYRGQAHHLTVEVGDAMFTEETWNEARERFARAHQEAFGMGRNEAVELVNVRVSCSRSVGRIPFHRAAPFDSAARHRANERVEQAAVSAESGDLKRRKAWSMSEGSFVSTPVLMRRTCSPGSSLPGPAIIDDVESTILVPAGWTASFLDGGTTRLDNEESTR